MNQSQSRLHPIWQVITPGEVAQYDQATRLDALLGAPLPHSLGQFLPGHPTTLEVLRHEETILAARRRSARRRLPARRLRRG